MIDSELSVNYSDKLGKGSYDTVYRGKYVSTKSSSFRRLLMGGRDDEINVAIKEIIVKEKVSLLDWIWKKRTSVYPLFHYVIVLVLKINFSLKPIFFCCVFTR